MDLPEILDSLRARARERFGSPRAGELEQVLAELAADLGAMDRFAPQPDDALQRTVPEDGP